METKTKKKSLGTAISACFNYSFEAASSKMLLLARPEGRRERFDRGKMEGGFLSGKCG